MKVPMIVRSRPYFCAVYRNLQLQERQIGIAIIGLVFALLGDVVLKYGRCFWVVSIKPVEYCVDMRRPLGRKIECYTHCRKEYWELEIMGVIR